MIPILIGGPAVEPVSLADLKGWLRLDGTADDELVATLATAARLMVEATSGRLLITQTWRLVLDRWPAERVVRVPLSPFAGLAAARVFAADGTAQGVPLTSFRVDTLAEPGRIELTAAVPDPGRDFAGIELDVVAGYGPLASDVPMPLRQAIRMLAARWYENRGDGPPLGEAALPVEVTALTAPYRRARL